MSQVDRKSLETPDETRKFDKGSVEVVNIGGGTVGRYRFEPGWRWSEHVKPIAGTDLCQAPHFMYQISGRMRIRTSDGDEQEVGPGDVAIVSPGHDAWVVGEEAVTGVDWSGLGEYAKR